MCINNNLLLLISRADLCNKALNSSFQSAKKVNRLPVAVASGDAGERLQEISMLTNKAYALIGDKGGSVLVDTCTLQQQEQQQQGQEQQGKGQHEQQQHVDWMLPADQQQLETVAANQRGATAQTAAAAGVEPYAHSNQHRSRQPYRLVEKSLLSSMGKSSCLAGSLSADDVDIHRQAAVATAGGGGAFVDAGAAAVAAARGPLPAAAAVATRRPGAAAGAGMPGAAVSAAEALPPAGDQLSVWIIAGQSNGVGFNEGDGQPMPDAAAPDPGKILMFSAEGNKGGSQDAKGIWVMALVIS